MIPETDRPALREPLAWGRWTKAPRREDLAALIRAAGETFAVLEPERGGVL